MSPPVDTETTFSSSSPGPRISKFGLSYITRDDIASLTKEASDISGIPYVLDCDKDEVEKILKG